jgi:hypothetical protein
MHGIHGIKINIIINHNTCPFFLPATALTLHIVAPSPRSALLLGAKLGLSRYEQTQGEVLVNRGQRTTFWHERKGATGGCRKCTTRGFKFVFHVKQNGLSGA